MSLSLRWQWKYLFIYIECLEIGRGETLYRCQQFVSGYSFLSLFLILSKWYLFKLWRSKKIPWKAVDSGDTRLSHVVYVFTSVLLIGYRSVHLEFLPEILMSEWGILISLGLFVLLIQVILFVLQFVINIPTKFEVGDCMLLPDSSMLFEQMHSLFCFFPEERIVCAVFYCMCMFLFSCGGHGL